MEKSEHLLPSKEIFADRHIGPNSIETSAMLHSLGLSSLEELSKAAIPPGILLQEEEVDPSLGQALSEVELIQNLRRCAAKNKVAKSWIGMGYANSHTPTVIQRNILENPGWYTQYTPYQPEIAQGRLEALLNFQTVITELTGLPVANASLLDEGTAAAEAMMLSFVAAGRPENSSFFASSDCHPQTLDLIQGRAEHLGINVFIGDHKTVPVTKAMFGALLQYPSTRGTIPDYSNFIAKCHEVGALVTLACDLLSLTLIQSPGELGADIAVGSSQRFGIPLGYGGPHAAFFASREEHKRLVPGRIVGVSKDTHGKYALRLALQTREQHIRREKALSNICTAQALLANMAGMYAVYHGPKGLRAIAERVHRYTLALKKGAELCHFRVEAGTFFDTISIHTSPFKSQDVLRRGWERGINLRAYGESELSVTLDETSTEQDVLDILSVVSYSDHLPFSWDELCRDLPPSVSEGSHGRKTDFLRQDVFHKYHSETEILRYMKRLESKDLSLAHSMIPLGSCTMKLNATTELLPLSWPEFSSLHPFAPLQQATGYQEILEDLERKIAYLTGFDAVSLQPNSGAQGEYAGLLVIRAYHREKGDAHRDVCLIPSSAHGTNPATAALANMKVVIVACDKNGNIDLEDLRSKAKEYQQKLAALMVTYPSTHGVFESAIQDICKIVHQNGGQVYMDGANLNAQIGLCRPGSYGPDVCHLNLHKTFSIPHGGGGPGAGPIAVKRHLAPFLPSHILNKTVGGEKGIHAVSSAPWGSSLILLISWSYMQMMGWEGMKKATQTAILNANYLAKRLEGAFEILYRGPNGFVAHECIIDVRPLKKTCGVEVQDIAKRLMDYGFHAPTVSFPVAGTLMIEPTESEGKEEIDRFCDAMLSIREEIREIEKGAADKNQNLLKNAPHTIEVLLSSHWDKPYSRERAAYPLSWVKQRKFWPSVSRIDEAYGDRNFICSCS